MQPPDSAYVFKADVWSAIESALRPLDPSLAALGARYGLKLLLTTSKGWPGRTLIRKRWLKTYLLRVSLEPASVDTGPLSFGIHHLWIRDLAGFYQKLIDYEPLATGLDAKSIAAGNATAVIEAAIRGNVG